MTGTTWIFFGVVCGAVALFAVPYGFHLKSKENSTFENPQQIVKSNLHQGDFVGRDKITINPPADKLKKGNSKISKLKINRLLENFNLELDKWPKEYDREAASIAQKFGANDRLYSSSHIFAHIAHAEKSNERLNEMFTQLNRSIQDILMENFEEAELSNIPQLSEFVIRVESLNKQMQILREKIEKPARTWDVRINKSPGITKTFKLN